MTEQRQRLGRKGENLAAAFLESKGMTILGRNLRTRYGEIDLVARHGEMLVFVEVRARTHARQGDPLETISRAKQAKIARMARWYLATNRWPADTCCRFDVVGVVCVPGAPPAVSHVENAFWV